MEKGQREGKNKRRNSDSRLILGRNLLRRNLISRLTKEFHYAEPKTLSIFVSASSSRGNSPRKREERPKGRRRWPRDTRYIRRVRAYVRRRLVGGDHAHACVPMFLRSFIQTHIDLVVRRSENVRRRGGGEPDCRQGDGEKAAGGNTESRRDGKISGGSKETAGGDRESRGNERETRGSPPRRADPRPLVFLDRARNVASLFRARISHGRATRAARILARGCVRPPMI